MTIHEAIAARYSVRKYLDQPVEEDKLRRVLEAARLAPSARNLQEWRFIVVRDAETRQRLVEAACGQEFVGEAPVVIAACAVTDGTAMTCGQTRYTVDVSIALEHIALAAVAEGLGTCWVCAFHAPEAKQILGVPDEVPIVALMTLGYPADEPRPKDRLPCETIVMAERWRPG